MPQSIAAGAIASSIGAARASDGWRTVRVSPRGRPRQSCIGASTAPEAVAGAEAIFSVVTADQAHEAAIAALPGVGKGAFFFDCDSCAPQTKERTAKEVDAAGGRYVDVAVMAPVHPRLHRTPLLISGPHAKDAAPVLAALDMAADIHEGPVGSSSAIKMIRSIMMKGLEALVCECVLAGRKAGVIETVLDSLDDTYPGFDWRRRSAYMLERVMTHGVRRAAEMREAALTVDLLGLDGAMSRASVGWQQSGRRSRPALERRGGRGLPRAGGQDSRASRREGQTLRNQDFALFRRRSGAANVAPRLNIFQKSKNGLNGRTI